jgi:hypothetical protein
LGAACFVGAAGISAEPVKILKVLPVFVDAEGRHSVSPSLYERDAYQAELRRDPSRKAAMRFDVQWKAPRASRDALQVRLELRGAQAHTTEPLVIEQPLKRTGWPECWTRIPVTPEAFKHLGSVLAWRATLRQGERVLAEQKSFLW